MGDEWAWLGLNLTQLVDPCPLSGECLVPTHELAPPLASSPPTKSEGCSMTSRGGLGRRKKRPKTAAATEAAAAKRRARRPCRFLQLPDDVLACVVQELDAPALGAASRTCTALHELEALKAALADASQQWLEAKQAEAAHEVARRAERHRNLSPRSLTPH